MKVVERFDVLVVGAGHAGAQTAIALRNGGFAGSVGVIGAEAEFPYERPPLSKEYLTGARSFERILIRPTSFWEERRVAMLLGRSVTRVRPDERVVETADGAAFGYGRLVWATGGSPRRLSCEGARLAGVHTIRERGDVDRLRGELSDVDDVVVVGAGYIGLEATSALTSFGKRIVVLEALPRVLMRVAGEPVSRFLEGEHRAHGVDVRLGCGVGCIEGVEDRVSAVRLSDGKTIEAGMVIVGIGIEPAVAPLLRAGATGGNGVLVDDRCRTSLPDVFAVGDCALHPNSFAAGALVRLESVQNANDQAAVAAATILGVDRAYDSVPWFWSNQYDLRIQTVGLSTGHDHAIVRGDPATRSFSVVYQREGRVVAVDAVNCARDYVHGRRLVVEGHAVDPADLADPARPLASLA